MKIDSSFYIKTWFSKSLMAIGTGLVVGYFSSVIIISYIPPVNALIGMIVSFLIYQYISFSLFFGDRRGEFEYQYRIALMEKFIKKLVLRSCGIFSFLNYFQDQFNSIRPAQKSICQKLLKDPKISKDDNSLFCLYYKLANLELREDNFKNEKLMLQSALALKPNDLLANFKYAICCEMDGAVDEAINYYELAAKDPYIVSESLKKYIMEHIERIKQKGPINRMPVLGLKYQSY